MQQMKLSIGILISVSMAVGIAIGTAEKNIPAGIAFAGAFLILFALLQMNVKRK
ncbi:MAG: hypothetical protein QM791_01515 [Ferruginibacter sp.]